MQTILEKYYIDANATLVKKTKGTNSVDCWFEFVDSRGKEMIAHRALSFEDFKTLIGE